MTTETNTSTKVVNKIVRCAVCGELKELELLTGSKTTCKHYSDGQCYCTNNCLHKQTDVTSEQE